MFYFFLLFGLICLLLYPVAIFFTLKIFIDRRNFFKEVREVRKFLESRMAKKNFEIIVRSQFSDHQLILRSISLDKPKLNVLLDRIPLFIKKKNKFKLIKTEILLLETISEPVKDRFSSGAFSFAETLFALLATKAYLFTAIVEPIIKNELNLQKLQKGYMGISIKKLEDFEDFYEQRIKQELADFLKRDESLSSDTKQTYFKIYDNKQEEKIWLKEAINLYLSHANEGKIFT